MVLQKSELAEPGKMAAEIGAALPLDQQRPSIFMTT
jgi:hypothetical protein